MNTNLTSKHQFPAVYSGEVESSHDKSDKLAAEDGESHNVTLVPYFHIISRQQFEKVAPSTLPLLSHLKRAKGQPPVSSPPVAKISLKHKIQVATH